MEPTPTGRELARRGARRFARQTQESGWDSSLQAPPRVPNVRLGRVAFGYDALKEEFLKADDRLGGWVQA